MSRPVDFDLKAVLFGFPVKHSRSPEIFAQLAKFGGPRVDFSLASIAPQDLPEALVKLRDGQWDAAGVTIPHKQDVGALMDEITGVAVAAGAINAIARRRDGRLVGTNTDGPGFVRALCGFAPHLCDQSTELGLLSGLRAVILGAGGAARGVAASLKQAGTWVCVVTRDPRGRQSTLGRLADSVISWEDPNLSAVCNGAQILIQATPVGMSPHVNACVPLTPAAVMKHHVVMDLVYTPWQTRFLDMARSQGARCVNGWPMLVHQAAVALDFWLKPGAGDDLVEAVGRFETRDPSGGAHPVHNKGRR